MTNYTVSDSVTKKVYAAEDTTVNISGKKVSVGDTLVYAISYTNSSREKVTVNITDTISKYTAYVKGSADNGGKYKDGVLSWNVDVEPGETVTVTFNATVKNTAKNAQIDNKAVITEGKNTYETNVVGNYTEEEKDDDKQEFNENTISTPAPNDDGKDEADISDSPQTGDTANLNLWFALLFVSGGVFFKLNYFKKKEN